MRSSSWILQVRGVSDTAQVLAWVHMWNNASKRCLQWFERKRNIRVNNALSELNIVMRYDIHLDVEQWWMYSPTFACETMKTGNQKKKALPKKAFCDVYILLDILSWISGLTYGALICPWLLLSVIIRSGGGVLWFSLMIVFWPSAFDLSQYVIRYERMIIW
jgi:hypothetical protein